MNCEAFLSKPQMCLAGLEEYKLALLQHMMLREETGFLPRERDN